MACSAINDDTTRANRTTLLWLFFVPRFKNTDPNDVDNNRRFGAMPIALRHRRFSRRVCDDRRVIWIRHTRSPLPSDPPKQTFTTTTSNANQTHETPTTTTLALEFGYVRIPSKSYSSNRISKRRWLRVCASRGAEMTEWVVLVDAGVSMDVMKQRRGQGLAKKWVNVIVFCLVYENYLCWLGLPTATTKQGTRLPALDE
jgi:hypothetical protein